MRLVAPGLAFCGKPLRAKRGASWPPAAANVAETGAQSLQIGRQGRGRAGAAPEGQSWVFLSLKTTIRPMIVIADLTIIKGHAPYARH